MIMQYALQYVKRITNHEKNTVMIFIIISVFKVFLIGYDKPWCMYVGRTEIHEQHFFVK